MAASDRQELMELRRLAELEAKAAAAPQKAPEQKIAEPDTSDTNYLALGAQGINKAVAGLGDAVLNTPNRLMNLGKAAVGVGEVLSGHPESAPQITPDPNYITNALYKTGVFSPEYDPKTEDQANAVLALQVGVGGVLSPAQTGRQMVGNILSSEVGALSSILAKKAGYGDTGQLVAGLVGQTTASAAMNSAGNAIAESRAARSRNATRDANNAEARRLGLSLSAEDTNPTSFTGKMESFSNKGMADKIRSKDNSIVVDNAARADLGLAPDTPLNVDTLSQVRRDSYQSGYEPMRNIGQVMPGAQYRNDLRSIQARYESAANSFPAAVRDDVGRLVASLDERIINSSNAVDMIRILRDDASSNFRNGENALGLARRDAARALENMLERSAANQGANGAALVEAFRDARQRIARSYSVEDALSKDGVTVSGQKLAQQLKRGDPLSGRLRVVAEAARTHPKSFQQQVGDVSAKIGLKDEIPALIAGGASGYMTGSPAAGAGIAATLGAIPLIKPAARSLVTSRAYQNSFGVPNYNPSVFQRVMSQGEVANPAANSAILATILANRDQRGKK